jgi:glycerol-3-phosphate dehydrogenase (NAD(P)+)
VTGSARSSGGGTRAAVLSAGSWGTAFAKVLADAGCDVVLHARRTELAKAIAEDGENREYLPGIRLPDRVRATADVAEALLDADVVVLAVPSQSLRDNLTAWAPLLPPGASLLSLMKGIELGSTRRMSEVICEVTGCEPDRVAALSGPNLAREIAEEQPAATVIACPDTDRAAALQAACRTSYFRPYTNADLIGCELGGAVKNVIALACGITEGLGFGDNTRASLITRGLAETARLGLVLGAEMATFAGLAGLGDLVATCSSPLSRNRTFGEKLGRGMTVEEVQHSTRQVAEGVKSCRSILDLARAHGVDVPITEAVVRVCHEGEAPARMVKEIMAREAKSE